VVGGSGAARLHLGPEVATLPFCEKVEAGREEPFLPYPSSLEEELQDHVVTLERAGAQGAEEEPGGVCLRPKLEREVVMPLDGDRPSEHSSLEDVGGGAR
jgi:hypothetical protein